MTDNRQSNDGEVTGAAVPAKPDAHVPPNQAPGDAADPGGEATGSGVADDDPLSAHPS